MSFASRETNTTWQHAGLIILCIRFVQGFIFWGGGSRRFIYAPDKLDPYAPQWMANKLQSAMPGALLDIQPVISFLLQHFILLYTSIIVFSLVELFSGLALITGTFTRLAGFITAGLSVTLMLIFGWEGGTCMDEWTMAVSTLAMGLTLAIAGGSAYSVDNFLLRRYPSLANTSWFTLCGSGAISFKILKRISLACLLFTILFTLTTYNYYRGAIFSRYHHGPVSPTAYHLSLSHGKLLPNGRLTFTMYADAGTTAQPNHIMRMVLSNLNGEILADWQGKNMLAPYISLKNTYDYNKIALGAFGLIVPTSAQAEISLLPPAKIHLNAGKYHLSIFTIDGQTYSLELGL